MINYRNGDSAYFNQLLNTMKKVNREYKPCFSESKVFIPPNILICCEPDCMEIQDGFYTCCICGLVKDQVLDDSITYTETNAGIYLTKTRFYKPINHFREHLRRFCGFRTTNLNCNLLQVDLHDRNAYDVIQKYLRKYKIRSEYKNVWSILYKLGGTPPVLSSKQHLQIMQYYMYFLQKFPEVKQNRKSVPNHDMVLAAILKKIGYDSFYHLPQIKSKKIKENILFILKTCLG